MSGGSLAEARKNLVEFVGRVERDRDSARALAARLAEALKDDADYFDNRADADNVGDPPVAQGNAEMYRLMDVERALAEYDAARKEWGT